MALAEAGFQKRKKELLLVSNTYKIIYLKKSMMSNVNRGVRDYLSWAQLDNPAPAQALTSDPQLPPLSRQPAPRQVPLMIGNSASQAERAAAVFPEVGALLRDSKKRGGGSIKKQLKVQQAFEKGKMTGSQKDHFDGLTHRLKTTSSDAKGNKFRVLPPAAKDTLIDLYRLAKEMHPGKAVPSRTFQHEIETNCGISIPQKTISRILKNAGIKTDHVADRID